MVLPKNVREILGKIEKGENKMKENRDKKPIEKDEKATIKNCRFYKISDYTISVESDGVIKNYEEIPIEKPSE